MRVFGVPEARLRLTDHLVHGGIWQYQLQEGGRSLGAFIQEVDILSLAPANGLLVIRVPAPQADDGVPKGAVDHRGVSRLHRQVFQPDDVAAVSSGSQGHHELILRFPRPLISQFCLEGRTDRNSRRGIAHGAQTLGSSPPLR